MKIIVCIIGYVTFIPALLGFYLPGMIFPNNTAEMFGAFFLMALHLFAPAFIAYKT